MSLCLSISVCVSVSLYVVVHVWVNVGMHVCSLECGGQGQPWVSLLRHLPPFLSELVSHWPGASASRLGRLASELQGSTCLCVCLITAGIADMLSHTWLFTWVTGIQTQVVMITRQAVDQLCMSPTLLSDF